MMTFEIKLGKGEGQTSRVVTLDPDDITLGFLEDLEAAQETGKWRDINPVIAQLLNLTRDEQRAITQRQFRDMAFAIQTGMEEASVIPNGR